MRYIVLISLLLSLALGVSADFAQKDWRYYKDIQVQRAGLQKLQLDKESFSGVQKDLRDLRIIADNSEEIPYKIVVEEERQISDRFSFQLKILNNAYTPGPQLVSGQNGQQPPVLGFQQFIVDFGPRLETPTHNYIEINTSERNFQKQVEIAGSDDAQNWQIIKSDGYIYDYTDTRGNFHAQNTVINYSLSTFRFLKVKIFSDQPFKINGAQVYEHITKEAKETLFDVVFTQTDNRETGYSLLNLDLGQDGLPSREVVLFTNDTNFDRPVFISGFCCRHMPGVLEEALGLGQGYIFRYNTPFFKGENLVLPYSENTSRHISVNVFNGDDKPIRFTGAQLKGIFRSIIFEANAGERHRLYYGNNQARRPVYDLERRFPYIDMSLASNAATLGPQQENSAFVKKLPPVSERYGFLLPSILVIISLFLLFLVYRFMKTVK